MERKTQMKLKMSKNNRDGERTNNIRILQSKWSRERKRKAKKTVLLENNSTLT